ncbi:radical SAM/SPASM domain-containing protein [Anaerocolumna sp. MB42-C2]|uniref:radical SAM/SPASM domain-containing protein n=1 Tax=Anaerocolumna sp. MB42-C2 TaxID=3070997 RepID=UPI0027E048D8|nr:radical SAM protein [Anaerocolumna sp. MB42-C2]WMJ87610.1 radical SAM protein [Anaerocolumna sp. MB42-C2]
MIYPNQFHVELTQQCNLNCLHCFADASVQNMNELSYEEVVEIYKQMKELGIIYANLSGGEPVLNKDFFKIVKYAAEQPFETCLLTNGLLWDDVSIEKLCKLDPNRNLTIQISLDGPFEVMTKERLITKMQYDKIINTIIKLKSYGFSVGCLIVLNLLTAATSLDTIKYAIYELNVDAVQAIPLFPTGRACENRNILQGFWKEWSKFVIDVTNIKKTNAWGDKSQRVNIGFFTLYELTEPLDRAGMHDDIYNVWGLDVSSSEKFHMQTKRHYYCEAGQTELTISSEKRLYPCVASIRTEFGGEYIEGKNIIDVWENDKNLNWFRSVTKKVISQEPCNNCEYKDICGGGCRIAALEFKEDKYAPDPRCPKVQEYFNTNSKFF